MNKLEIYDYIIKIQSIAKIGLTCSKDQYALKDYAQINSLSKQLLEQFEDVKIDRPNYFIKDQYPTPNISVRTVILNNEKTHVLMVKEAKSKTWSLPGGWCDLYDSPSQAAKKECLEESGIKINVIRLIGLLNYLPLKTDRSIPEYVVIFQGEINKDFHTHDFETTDVKWFDINNLPKLNPNVLEKDIKRMILATINNETIFD